MSEKSFWQFSLAIYTGAGVKSLLLRLQDEFGADINMLLFCYWLGLQQRLLTAGQWAELQRLTADWRKESILPLRSVRRFLKQQSGMAGFRQKIQAVELEAERLQQEMMENFLVNNPLTSSNNAPDQAAWQNLQAYFASLPTIEWLLVADTNTELHQLIDLTR